MATTLPFIDNLGIEGVSPMVAVGNIWYIRFATYQNWVDGVMPTYVIPSELIRHDGVIDEFLEAFIEFINQFLIENENNSGSEVGFKFDGVYATPEHAPEYVKDRLKYEANIVLDTSIGDRVLEVVSGTLPNGLTLTQSNSNTFKISGHISRYAMQDYLSTVTVSNQKGMEDLISLYSNREIVFDDVKYIDSVETNNLITPTTPLIVGDGIRDYANSNNPREITKIETVANKLQISINEFMGDDIFVIGTSKFFTNTQKSIFARYSDVQFRIPKSIQDEQVTVYKFTLGMRSSNSSTYIDTTECTIKVRTNYDITRDFILQVDANGIYSQGDFDKIHGGTELYYSGDLVEPEVSDELADLGLTFMKTDGDIDIIKLFNDELLFDPDLTDEIDIEPIPVLNNTSIQFFNNVEDHKMLRNNIKLLEIEI